ncbi:hypothetical protein G8O24_29595 [Bradyrhizobium sp. INPA01-394B]|uniref:Uncharacterized protein n=1 Tax=Bradyrhizobium campsiandrae TaxID=1729892 RepID=A0ABR7UBD5_9BRAD|nr:hypothetical protein [Bradyrhizobium campsiandrae]MBC9881483.1 hypothetical protein [Bradyrhizobium campsiandrae]MBC9981410.1 hypothetical protein [Bradyrhizobium campsiandrae]
MATEDFCSVSLKNPDAIAVIVSALRDVHGDDIARMMLVEGMSLANLIDAMFSAPLTHREAVRAMTDGLDDFVITPDLGLIWHLKYIYADHSLHVVDLEIATPDGTLASKDVWLRLAA